MPKISLSGSKVSSFGEILSIVADVNDGGTPYMVISPRRARPCTHRPEQEQEAINAFHLATLRHGTRSGRMALKKCVFGCFVLFVDERFINKAEFESTLNLHIV